MSKMYIPPKPKGGSLDLKMLVNYQFPYMHKAVMKGEVMPGVAYDYAVGLIQNGKAVVAGVQIASKVNDDGGTGEKPAAPPPSPVKNLDWGSKKKDTSTKDVKK